MKRCSKCREVKELTAFGKHKGRVDGLNNYCKPCMSAAVMLNKKQLVMDPFTGEFITKATRQKRRLTIDPLTGERVSLGALIQRKLVIDPVTGEQLRAGALASRKRYKDGKHKEYMEEYLKDPVRKLRYSIATLINTSFKRQGWSKQTKTYALLGCSFKEFHQHLGPKPTEDAHMDHILPCSYAQTKEELEAFQHWSNFQWLPAKENLSKSDALPIDAKEQKERLLALYRG